MSSRYAVGHDGLYTIHVCNTTHTLISMQALERGSRDLTGIAIEALRKRVEGLDPSICDVAEELIHIYCKPDPRQMGQDPFGSIFQTLLRGGG
jgi:hypothetical protein